MPNTKRFADGRARRAMTGPDDARIAAWRTSNRATVQFVRALPAALWNETLPGIPRPQLVLPARQLGHRLPPAVTAGLWRWRPR